MRLISTFGLIGTLLGLLAFLVLSSIAVPAYDEYLMPQAMYQDLVGMIRMLKPVEAIGDGLPWIALLLLGWVWFLLAGQLNPALARRPLGTAETRSRAWVTLIGGGLLFLLAIYAIFSGADPIWQVKSFGKGADMETFSIGLGMMAGAVAWLAVSPRAFGRLEGERPARRDWLAAAQAGALGALFVLFLYVVLKLVGAAVMTWMTVAVDAFADSMEVGSSGMLSMGAVLVIGSTVGVAIAFGLLPVFVPGAGDWRARMAASRPALVLTAGAIVLAVVSLMPLGAMDTSYTGNKQLGDAADLGRIQPLSLRLVKFCGDSKCRDKKDTSDNPALMAKAVGRTVAASGNFASGGFVPLHPDTSPALERFLAEKGGRSVLRTSAIWGATQNLTHLWQPNEAFQLGDRLVRQGTVKYDSLLNYQLRLGRLEKATPIDADTRALLEALSDEKAYHHGARKTAVLAAAWARFGDMARAEALLAKAKNMSPGKLDYVKLAPNDLFDGQISGQLAMPGNANAGIRLGLFRQNESALAKPDKANPAKDATHRFATTNVVSLAESVVLAADGRFSFKNLGAGDYYLAAMIPEERLQGKSSLKGANVPDVIRLGATERSRDLGVIELSLP